MQASAAKDDILDHALSISRDSSNSFAGFSSNGRSQLGSLN